jgi:mono/diheme cytochrome c family protein
MKFLLAAGLVLAPCLAALPAQAQPALHQYPDADLALGEKLIRDNRCAACHAGKVGGDGSAIHRPKGRINSPGALRGMVDYCSTELNLGLFAEEVTAVAAVLQRDHYRFPAQSPAPR